MKYFVIRYIIDSLFPLIECIQRDALGGFERHKGRGSDRTAAATQKFPASFVNHVMFSHLW